MNTRRIVPILVAALAAVLSIGCEAPGRGARANRPGSGRITSPETRQYLNNRIIEDHLNGYTSGPIRLHY